MITNIGLDCINSYKRLSALKTDKKINLIYGLNGTGKSTLTNYLYDKDAEDYKSCTIEGLGDDILLVYNQKFIQDTFYEPENLKGIFTLSKENKDAKKKIINAQNEIEKFENIKVNEIRKQKKILNEQNYMIEKAEEKVWETKKDFTGGDRILEFCLEGLKGSKEKLFQHMISLPKPKKKPLKTSEILKKETEALQGKEAKKHSLIPIMEFRGIEIESDPIFKLEIIGNTNSTVAELIQKLNNSDWVKKGLGYLPVLIGDDGAQCPFCQKNTITNSVVSNIKDFFDETYEKNVNALKKLYDDYQRSIYQIQSKDTYVDHQFILESKSEFENLFTKTYEVFNINKTKILEKLETPSKNISLINSSKTIEKFNNYINNINALIKEHNIKINNKDKALENIKNTFWSIMRWEYDQTLSSYIGNDRIIQKELSSIKAEIVKLDCYIGVQKEIISKEQKNTVNIDEAVTNINNGLIDLGIHDFSIAKYSDVLYKIIREEKNDATFQTLSEGEKMIISFLYFRELCKGKKSATEVDNKKIIVIDDPISSLSHIYIFNIGCMIKKEFLNSKSYEQVFVLTHSLYFFYELTDKNHDRRKENQKLFRMIKNNIGSQIIDMDYKEIQSDYQSYWYIIKDEEQPPSLIANCMRNIIEYFFNFIEKKDLNDVFQKKELQKNKYQAFRRYIDRESHSDWQNIFDYKEFNYADFRDAFGLVFKESGYPEHYKEMMK